MSGQGLLIAWVIGLHMGAAMLVSRVYMVLVVAYFGVLAITNAFDVTGHWLVLDMMVVVGFVIMSFGAVQGAMALWYGGRK